MGNKYVVAEGMPALCDKCFERLCSRVQEQMAEDDASREVLEREGAGAWDSCAGEADVGELEALLEELSKKEKDLLAEYEVEMKREQEYAKEELELSRQEESLQLQENAQCYAMSKKTREMREKVDVVVRGLEAGAFLSQTELARVKQMIPLAVAGIAVPNMPAAAHPSFRLVNSVAGPPELLLPCDESPVIRGFRLSADVQDIEELNEALGQLLAIVVAAAAILKINLVSEHRFSFAALGARSWIARDGAEGHLYSRGDIPFRRQHGGRGHAAAPDRQGIFSSFVRSLAPSASSWRANGTEKQDSDPSVPSSPLDWGLLHLLQCVEIVAKQCALKKGGGAVTKSIFHDGCVQRGSKSVSVIPSCTTKEEWNTALFYIAATLNELVPIVSDSFFVPSKSS